METTNSLLFPFAFMGLHRRHAPRPSFMETPREPTFIEAIGEGFGNLKICCEMLRNLSALSSSTNESRRSNLSLLQQLSELPNHLRDRAITCIFGVCDNTSLPPIPISIQSLLNSVIVNHLTADPHHGGQLNRGNESPIRYSSAGVRFMNRMTISNRKRLTEGLKNPDGSPMEEIPTDTSKIRILSEEEL